MNNIKKKFKSILAIFFIFSAVLILSVSTYAANTPKGEQECVGDDSDSDRCILYKAALTNIWRCYYNDGVEEKFDHKNKFENYTKIFKNSGFKQYLPLGYADTHAILSDFKAETCHNTVKDNNGYSGVTTTDYTVGGQKFNLDYINNAISQAGAATSFENMDKFLSGWGYARGNGNGSDRKAFTITGAKYSKMTTTTILQIFSGETQPQAVTSKVVSFDTNDKGEIKTVKKFEKTAMEYGEDSVFELETKDGNKTLKITVPNNGNNTLDPFCFRSNRKREQEFNVVGKTVDGLESDITSWIKDHREDGLQDSSHLSETFKNFANNGKDATGYLAGAVGCYIISGGESITTGSDYYYYIDFKNGTEDDFSAEYKLDTSKSKSELGVNAAYHLSGEDSRFKTQSGLAFSKKQAAVFAENRLMNFYGGSCGKQNPKNTSNCNSATAFDLITPSTGVTQEDITNYLNSGYRATKWMNQNGTFQCALFKFANDSSTELTPSLKKGETYWYYYGYVDKRETREQSFDILNAMLGSADNACSNYDPENNLDDSDEAKSDLDPATANTQQSGPITGHAESDDACKNVSGLAWLLCPIIELASNAVVSIYNNIVEPLLKVEPTLFKREGSGTFEAWSVFRNISNILLIIFFLVIIFSQLTGIGIDNYGIKKTLPRLITAALLINLSYIISQASVDLSNILGKSLNATFDSLADLANVKGAIPPSDSGIGGGIAAEATISVAVIGGTVAGITAAGGWAAVAGAALSALPAVVAALIAALIAVVFFFVLLGARQAGVVILVVISPLAFACYMLPNTKKFFDRWKKAFTALLLLYPIAGALMGGGGFTSAVLLNVNKSSDQNFWFQIVALLVQVIPFFFIPSLLKSSFAALGNIGNKISGFGQRLGRSWGGAAKRGISNSGTYKNARLATANARAAARQERLQSSLDKKVADGDYYIKARAGARHDNQGFALDKDGHRIKATRYSELSEGQRSDFAKKNTDFRTQDKLMKIAQDDETQKRYAAGVAAGAQATTEQTQDSIMGAYGDSEEKAMRNALNGDEFIEKITTDEGDELEEKNGQFFYKYNKEGHHKAGQIYDTTGKKVKDKHGQEWTVDEKGQLYRNTEKGREYWKRKEYKGSDNHTYHYEDRKLINEKGEALKEGVTVYGENGLGFQLSKGTGADGSDEYRVMDIKPVDIDKDAKYQYDGHECHFEGDELVYEDEKGNKAKVKEGAEVLSASGKNAGYSYKMGTGGLELTKSADIKTQSGKKVAFYAGKNGKFELHDVDQYNANSGRMKELEGKLELAREKLDHLPDGQARMEAGREVAALGTELDNLRASTELGDGTELGVGNAKFKYGRGSGTLAALSGALEDDTAGFKYRDADLRVNTDMLLETTDGNPETIKSNNMPRRATYRNAGDGVFRDIETGNELLANEVSQARANGQVVSHNDLRMKQARISLGSQIGSMAGVISVNENLAAQGTILGSQNKTISQMNTTVGEGQALIEAHDGHVETAASVETATQGAYKQFEGVMSGNVAARERSASYMTTSGEKEDIITKAIGADAHAELTRIANSTTENAGKRALAQVLLDNGAYVGGSVGVDAGNPRRDIERYVNTFTDTTPYSNAGLTAGERASIERLTVAERAVVDDAIASGAGINFLNNPNINEGQRLYFEQVTKRDPHILGGATEAANSDVRRAIQMSMAEAGQRNASAALVGKTTLQTQQAVTAGATKVSNQFKQEIASNATGEVETNMEVALHQARNSRTLKEQEQQAYVNALNNKELQENGQSLLTVKADKAYNQAQRRIFTTAAQNMLDDKTPDFQTITADVVARRKSEEVKASEARITNDPRHIIDSPNALYDEGMIIIEDIKRNGINDRNEADLRAITNLLSRNGDAGQEQAHNLLIKTSTDQESEGNTEAQRIIASQIINSFGSEYKTKQRSTFDHAQQILREYASAAKNAARDGTAVTIDMSGWAGNISANIGSFDAQTLAGLNDGEFTRLQTAIKNGDLSLADTRTLVSKIQEAKNNPNISLKPKVENMFNQIRMEAIVKDFENAGPELIISTKDVKDADGVWDDGITEKMIRDEKLSDDHKQRLLAFIQNTLKEGKDKLGDKNMNMLTEMQKKLQEYSGPKGKGKTQPDYGGNSGFTAGSGGPFNRGNTYGTGQNGPGGHGGGLGGPR